MADAMHTGSKAVSEAGSGRPQQIQAGGVKGAKAGQTHLWFEDSVVVPDEFRNLLVKYSHISPAEVDEHVLQVVSEAPQVTCHHPD